MIMMVHYSALVFLLTKLIMRKENRKRGWRDRKGEAGEGKNKSERVKETKGHKYRDREGQRQRQRATRPRSER